MTPLFAGIDAGGTAFKCIVARGPDAILRTHTIPVTTPAATLAQCAEFFQNARTSSGSLAALGIASFGPIERDPESVQFGQITTTPKPGWANTDIVGYFQQALNLPIAFDTDVNGALLAESIWGAAQGQAHAVYVTVGTGIGVGAMCAGALLHGTMHPEAGHARVAIMPGDNFAGICPYHGNCLEGLIAGPALAARLGFAADDARDDHPVWQVVGYYLGSLCMNLALHYSPARIILGGGVMARAHLLNIVRQQFQNQLNGYLAKADAQDIVAAALGSQTGALGAIALAQQQYRSN